MTIVLLLLYGVAAYTFGWSLRRWHDRLYIRQMRETLEEAADVFDYYAGLHMAKGPGHEAKANRNRRLALAMLEATKRPATSKHSAQLRGSIAHIKRNL